MHVRGLRDVGARGLAAALGVSLAAGLAGGTAYATGLDDPRCVKGRVLDVADVVDFPTLKQLRSVAQEFPRPVQVKVLTYDGLPDGEDLDAALASALDDCDAWGYEPGEDRSLFLLGVDADSGAVASIFDGALAERFVETQPVAEDAAVALLEEGDPRAALAVALGTYAAAVQPGVDGPVTAPEDPLEPTASPGAAGADDGAVDADGASGADASADGAEESDGSGGGLLIVGLLVLAVLLVGLGLLARTRLGRRRLAQQAEELEASRASLTGQIDRLREQRALLEQSAAGLPDHDDAAVLAAHGSVEQATSAADAAERTARQAAAEHAIGPAAEAAAPPSAEQIGIAAAAFAAARVEAADALERVTSAAALIERLDAALDAHPARIAAAADDVAALDALLADLRTRGYRTTDYDHVPPALAERLEEARRQHEQRRAASVEEMIAAIDADVTETRRRLERLDEERAALAEEIEALGGRTPQLDAALDDAHRSLARLSAAVAPATVEEPRALLEEAGTARAALPRLLRDASEESSVERQQLVHARRHLSEAAGLYDRAEQLAREARVRLDELMQVAQDLPISADRTAARAQRLAERVLLHAQALGGEDLKPHGLGSRARALGDEARSGQPDLVDIAVRLDLLRREVADAERRLEDLVTAHAARRLAVSAARAQIEEASAAPTAGDEKAAASLRAAADLLAQAEAEPDHARARDLADEAAETARRAGGSAS